MSTTDDIYKGFFIPKGQILLNYTFCTIRVSVNHWPQRIYYDSEWMVHQSPIYPYIHLKYSQGDLARPRIVPRPGRIQARAFSQRGRERPRRPGALFSFWGWQEDLSWTSLCRCHNLHRCCVGDLRIQRDEGKRRERPRNPCQGRDIWSKRTRHVSPSWQHFSPPIVAAS
jgi:hypothetical protein